MTFPRHTRRKFLAAAGAMAVAGPDIRSFGASQQDDASSLVKGKDNRLLVLKKYPAVFETPLNLLAEQAITPKSLLFVRNNQQPEDTATVGPSSHTNWNVKLSGGITQEVSVSLAQLDEMEMTEYEMVLQCSGNGRSLFSKAAQTNGTQWGKGGMGNVRFAGVRLIKVLENSNLGIDPAVQFINASGADSPENGKEDFLHSLPIHDVLNRSILALYLNGERLPAIHGGPVRLITPGVYATMHMKWLSELRFVTDESTNHNHVPRYRVPHRPIMPGSEYDFKLQNSSFNWNMKTKSVLLTPGDEDRLRSGPTIIKGVAFNDGQASIASVILSFDHGQSWQQATLMPHTSKYGWTRFRLQKNFSAGRKSIWCRAIDSHGRSQPLEGSVAWNPSGYEWNGIEKITVNVG
ncbi:MAG: molybdopterin-dependent oxidoreductase [Fuerstiella sp.]|nr:molybdopterin-dependent oxidoreductase [Fuerstiella sp.]